MAKQIVTQPYGGMPHNSKNEGTIDPTNWMNFKMIMMNERN
jgi:hypothetical protein